MNKRKYGVYQQQKTNSWSTIKLVNCLAMRELINSQKYVVDQRNSKLC